MYGILLIDYSIVLQIIPILRAGLALAEHASSVLPATKTYHLGKEWLEGDEQIFTVLNASFLLSFFFWFISHEES